MELYGYSLGMAVGNEQVYGDNFFIQTAGTDRPTLSVSAVTRGIQLRWPASSIGYQLETRTVLSPVSWTHATQIPTRVNGTNVLEAPIDSETRFFRLTK